MAIRFTCLGPAALRVGGGERRLRTRKQAALLYYLARLCGRGVTRDTLAALFWGEDEERKARHSLTQSILLINGALGTDAIEPDGVDRVRLRGGAIELDVAEFEAAASAGDHDVAVKLWRGPLLEGLFVRRAPRLEEWLGAERDRLFRLYRRAAHLLLVRRRKAGDHDALRELAEALLEQDALDEKAMLAHLESLVLGGDRALALRRYAAFECRLRDELDAEPGTELQGWARRLRRTTPVARSQPYVRVAETFVLPAAQPLFGRDEEFGALWRAWQETGEGRGSFWLIEGEAGIGKSALVAKLANQVHVMGGSVCFVKCYASERSVAFAPLADIVRQLVEKPGFLALSPTWIGELTSIVPDLRDRFPAAPEPREQLESARARLADAAWHAAGAVSDEYPLLLVVDDVHDADEATLPVIHYVGRQAGGVPVMVVTTVRTGGALQPVAQTFVDTIRHGGLGSTMALGPLDAAALARLTAAVAASRGKRIDDDMIDAVATRAGGNPLRAMEAAISYATQDRPSLLVARTEAVEGPPKEAFSASAERRLEHLSRGATAILAALAVSGRQLSDYELAQVTGLGPADLGMALAELDGTAFLQRTGACVAFSHDDYAQAVSAVLSDDSKHLAHLRLGVVLAASAARNPAARIEVATHFEAAGRRRRALQHARVAADNALAIGASRSAVDALMLVRRLATKPSIELFDKLGACLLDLGEVNLLRSVCHEVGPALSRRVDSPQLRYFEAAADLDSGARDFSSIERELHELSRSRGPSFPGWQDSQLLLVRVATHTNNHRIARRAARALRTVQGRSPHALVAAAIVRAAFGHSGLAVPLAEECLARLRAAGTWRLEQPCMTVLCIALKHIGRYRDSLSWCNKAIAIARKTMNPVAERRALENRAVTEIAAFADGTASATLGEAAQVRIGGWAFDLLNRLNRAVIELYDGDPSEALRVFDAVHQQASEQGDRQLAIDALGHACVAHVFLGNLGGLERTVRLLEASSPPADRKTLVGSAVLGHRWFRAIVCGEASDVLREVERELSRAQMKEVDHLLNAWFQYLILLDAAGQCGVKERGDFEHAATAAGAFGLAASAARVRFAPDHPVRRALVAQDLRLPRASGRKVLASGDRRPTTPDAN